MKRLIARNTSTGEIIADLAKGRRPGTDIGPFLPTRFRAGVAKVPLKDKTVA